MAIRYDTRLLLLDRDKKILQVAGHLGFNAVVAEILACKARCEDPKDPATFMYVSYLSNYGKTYIDKLKQMTVPFNLYPVKE